MILWAMTDIIPIGLVDVVVPMTLQVVVMVVPQINVMELVQIVPLLLNFEDDVGIVTF